MNFSCTQCQSKEIYLSEYIEFRFLDKNFSINFQSIIENELNNILTDYIKTFLSNIKSLEEFSFNCNISIPLQIKYYCPNCSKKDQNNYTLDCHYIIWAAVYQEFCNTIDTLLLKYTEYISYQSFIESRIIYPIFPGTEIEIINQVLEPLLDNKDKDLYQIYRLALEKIPRLPMGGGGHFEIYVTIAMTIGLNILSTIIIDCSKQQYKKIKKKKYINKVIKNDPKIRKKLDKLLVKHIKDPRSRRVCKKKVIKFLKTETSKLLANAESD